jgi:hypothetical protein
LSRVLVISCFEIGKKVYLKKEFSIYYKFRVGKLFENSPETHEEITQTRKTSEGLGLEETSLKAVKFKSDEMLKMLINHQNSLIEFGLKIDKQIIIIKDTRMQFGTMIEKYTKKEENPRKQENLIFGAFSRR